MVRPRRAASTRSLAKCSPTSNSNQRWGEVEPGQVVQFERLGYFAADLDEPTIFHRTVGLRDEWAKIEKRRQNESR